MSEARLTYKNPAKIIFNDSENCDVKFVFPDHMEIIHAHSNILCLECPKLYELIRGNIYGACSVVIKNTSTEAFLELLKFIYTDTCNLQFSRYNELLLLANQFDVPQLRKYLSDSLDQIKLENVLDMLQFCLDNQGYEDVSVKVIKFIGDNFKLVLESKAFLSVNKRVLCEILKVDECNIIETDLFDAVIKHGEAKGQSNIREYLGDIVKLIRFPSMTIKEFTRCLSKCNNILLPHESLDIVMEINEGIKNKFGFINKSRDCAEVILNELPKTNPIKINIKRDTSVRSWRYFKNCFNSNCTINSKNPFIIEGIEMLPFIYHVDRVNIQLLNEKNVAILNLENVTNNGIIPFKPIVKLKPNSKYTISIRGAINGYANVGICVNVSLINASTELEGIEILNNHSLLCAINIIKC